jgi:ankyrin repeat protein
MSSLTISRIRNHGESDEETARIHAKTYGIYAIVRYKNTPDISKFTDFGTCENEIEINNYLTSPHCHSAELIYRCSKTPIKFSYQTTILDALEALADDEHLKPVIQTLIDDDKPVNAKSDSGWTALHEAAKIGSAEIASLLISHDADLDATNDGTMYTPLHIAAHYGHLDIIKLLIKNGVDIHQKCNDGGTAIHIAADKNNVDVIEFLLSQGDDVNAKDGGGGSPLHSAVGRNHMATVSFLLKNGADVNFQNDLGVSPLHYAAYFNQPEMISILLINGASKDLTDHEGNTPLQVGKDANHVEVVEYLSQTHVPADQNCDDGEVQTSTLKQKKWWQFWK